MKHLSGLLAFLFGIHASRMNRNQANEQENASSNNSELESCEHVLGEPLGLYDLASVSCWDNPLDLQAISVAEFSLLKESIKAIFSGLPLDNNAPGQEKRESKNETSESSSDEDSESIVEASSWKDWQNLLGESETVSSGASYEDEPEVSGWWGFRELAATPPENVDANVFDSNDTASPPRIPDEKTKE